MRNCTIEISVKNKLLFLIILIFNAFLGKFVGQEIQKIPKKEVAGTLKKRYGNYASGGAADGYSEDQSRLRAK